jgi:hypothetical protein
MGEFIKDLYPQNCPTWWEEIPLKSIENSSLVNFWSPDNYYLKNNVVKCWGNYIDPKLKYFKAVINIFACFTSPRLFTNPGDTLAPEPGKDNEEFWKITTESTSQQWNQYGQYRSKLMNISSDTEPGTHGFMVTHLGTSYECIKTINPIPIPGVQRDNGRNFWNQTTLGNNHINITSKNFSVDKNYMYPPVIYNARTIEIPEWNSSVTYANNTRVRKTMDNGTTLVFLSIMENINQDPSLEWNSNLWSNRGEYTEPPKRGAICIIDNVRSWQAGFWQAGSVVSYEDLIYISMIDDNDTTPNMSPQVPATGLVVWKVVSEYEIPSNGAGLYIFNNSQWKLIESFT